MSDNERFTIWKVGFIYGLFSGISGSIIGSLLAVTLYTYW
jgi:hypothetical protein